jgi:hypothetical protein
LVNINSGTTENLQLFGIYKTNKDYNDLSGELCDEAIALTSFDDIRELFEYNKLSASNDEIEDISQATYFGIEDVIKTKLENMSSLNLIKDFEEIRDNIIKNLDKLNFIIKNGYDVKLENGVSSNVILTSFIGDTFYSEYSNCIDYIKNNVTTMNEKLNNDIEEPTGFSDELRLEFLLKTITPEDKTVIMDKIKEYREFSEDLINELDSHMDGILEKPKTYNLRYGKKPKRKNGKPVVYNIGTSTVTTTTPEIKQIFSTSNSVTENLNYYKK